MKLLIQLLILSTINFFLRFALWLVQLMVRLLVPLLRILYIPVFMSFTATVLGPREYISRVAYEWAQWLIDRGANPREISRLTGLCRVLVAAALVIGWTFSALFTVAMLRVVYGFFI